MSAPAGFTSITGGKFQSLSGTPLANGRMNCYGPVNNSSQAISAMAGGGSLAVGTVTFLIVNGAITTDQFGGPAQLADTRLSEQQNIGYVVTVIDTSTGDEVQGPGYGCVQPHGATWSFDTDFDPAQGSLLTVTSGPAGQSTYEIWLSLGNTGTEQDFMNSQRGANGSTTPNFVAPITAPGAEFTGDVLASRMYLPDGSGDRPLGANSLDAWKIWEPQPGVAGMWLTRTGNYLQGPPNLLPIGSTTTQQLDLSLPAGAFAHAFTSPDTGPIGPNNYGMIGGSRDANGTPVQGAAWNRQGQVISDSVLNTIATTLVGPGVPLPQPPLHMNWATGLQYVEPSPGALAWLANIFTPVTGQSLSIGADANAALTTVHDSSLNTYTFSQGGTRGTTLGNHTSDTRVPLVEQLGPSVGGSQAGETTQSGFLNPFVARMQSVASANLPGNQVFNAMISSSGVGGAVYASICGPTDYTSDHVNGSPSFQEMMSQVEEAVRLQPGTIVPFWLLVHGEFDASGINGTGSPNYNYYANLATWQMDVQTGVKSRTGQTGIVPMILVANIEPITAIQQFQAAMASGGKIVHAGPEYMLPHVTVPPAAYNLHLTAYGYRLLGEYQNQAAYRIAVERRPWYPTMPYQIRECVSTTLKHQVVVDFLTPYGDPLAIDTTAISQRPAYGFSLTDSTGAITPTSVSQTGPTQLTFYLDSPLSPTGRTLSYGTQTPGSTNGLAYPGPHIDATNVPGGNIRDTSARLSYYPDATGNLTLMHNWLVPFSLAI